MDLELVRKGLLDFSRKKKRWVLLFVALGFSSYSAYKVCNFPFIAQKREKISNVVGALVSIAEVISETAETIGVVSKDLKDFLQSKSDKIPSSLKQMSKITRSNEFSESVVTLTQALTMGILRGYQSSETSDHGESYNDSPCFLDKVLDRLSSPAGSDFVSAVVGSMAKNLVFGVYEEGKASGGLDMNPGYSDGATTDSVAKWVDLISSSKSKELIGDSIQLFVSTAVAVYLEKTMHINPYDEFFAGMTNPKHEKEVQDVLILVCSNAVETLVKTSHQVLTKDDTDTMESPDLGFGQGKSAKGGKLCDKEKFLVEPKLKQVDEPVDGGRINKVFSTLSMQSNRSFVLDVTGKVTFEAVRTFLEFLVEKLCAATKRCLDLVHYIVVESGLEVARYVTAKSSVVATVFLSVCLHILDGAWILAPA